MKKIIKQILAVFLATVIVLGMFSLNYMKTSATQEKKQDVTYSSTTALGEILTNSMEEKSPENDSYYIREVVVDGLTARVTLCAPDSSRLVVAIYNESTGIMITSGYTNVDSRTETVEIELGSCSMPDFFLVKAFILTADNMPVCKNYESLLYTQAYQEFLSKTVFDFDPEKVINLDYGYQNNFAVVSDEAKKIEQSSDENIIIKNDYENGEYCFNNSDSNLQSLKPNDILYFVYGDGTEDYILTKVGEINVTGDTVTIIADDEFEISEFFCYIKLDTDETVYESEAHSTVSTMSVEERNVRVFDNHSMEHKIAIEKEFEDEDSKNFKVSFLGELGIKFYLQFYYDVELFGEDYYELTHSITTTFSGTIDTKVLAKKECEPLILFKGGIPVYAGVEAEICFSLKFIFAAEVTASGGIEIKMVNGSRKVCGLSEEDLSKEPSIVLKFEIEGKLSVDMIPSISVGFRILKYFTVGLEASVDFNISAAIKDSVDFDVGDFEFQNDTIHNCFICIGGECVVTASIDLKISYGLYKKNQKNLLDFNFLSVETELGKFYISFVSIGDNNVSFAGFGWGECPNIKYKATYTVFDQDGDIIKGAEISDGTNTLVTDSDGKTYAYYNEGKYTYTVACDGYLVDETKSPGFFTVSEHTVNVNIYMKKESDDDLDTGDDSINESGVSSSGVCGDNLTWTLYNDGEIVISGTGKMYDYYSSSSIPWNSLKQNIKKITIKDGVESVGNISFKSCSNAEIAKIPGSVERIGQSSFAYCENLTTVTISNGVKSIAAWAFEHCPKLDSIAIPDSVTDLGSAVFDGCSGLKSAVIGNGVTKIWDDAFYGCLSLETVKIGSSVKEIANSAFKSCHALTNVTIPSNVEKIGQSAFAYCENLKTVTISSGVKSIDAWAFEHCPKLDSIAIPDSVTDLGSAVFDGCSGLKSAVIGNGVTKIWDDAFYGCLSLETVKIGSSVKEIANSAFKSCHALTNVTIPSNVEKIGQSAFAYCENLKTVTISSGVKSIDAWAFEHCPKLDSIAIPDSVTDLGSAVFDGCSGLKSAVIGNGVTKIWDDAFYGCLSLETVKIGSSVKEIANSAFKSCHALTNVTIPSNVEKIGQSAFAYCENLKNVTISSGVKSIDAWAFEYCEKLESVVIPNTIEYIGQDAFKHCGNISNVYYSGSKSQWDTISISSGNNDILNSTINYNYSPQNVISTLSVDLETCSVSRIETNQNQIITADNTIRGNGYVVLVFKTNSKDLSNENLLYIDQKQAEEDELLFNISPKSNDAQMVIVSGVFKNGICSYYAFCNALVSIKNNDGSKTINYGETLHLTAITSNMPADAKIYWYIDGVKKGEGETFNVNFENGTKTVEVKLVDSNGNVLKNESGNEITDSESVTVKGGFFQKIISFFKNLFGINRTVVQAIFKSVL